MYLFLVGCCCFSSSSSSLSISLTIVILVDDFRMSTGSFFVFYIEFMLFNVSGKIERKVIERDRGKTAPQQRIN